MVYCCASGSFPVYGIFRCYDEDRGDADHRTLALSCITQTARFVGKRLLRIGGRLFVGVSAGSQDGGRPVAAKGGNGRRSAVYPVFLQ